MPLPLTAFSTPRGFVGTLANAPMPRIPGCAKHHMGTALERDDGLFCQRTSFVSKKLVFLHEVRGFSCSQITIRVQLRKEKAVPLTSRVIGVREF